MDLDVTEGRNLSKPQQDKPNKEAHRRAKEFIHDQVCPALRTLFVQNSGSLNATTNAEDPQLVSIHFPCAFFGQ